MRFTIPYTPVSKKNHQRIVRFGGRPAVLPSKQYVEYGGKAVASLREQMAKIPADFPLSGTYEVVETFYMPTRRVCDLTNMEECCDDVLVKAGVLKDDNYKVIESHDGSRVKYDKDNPRTEILIIELAF